MLENSLLKGLKKQARAYDLICLDNSQGQFASAAQALNHGARLTNAASAYILFAHQDICFASDAWLGDAEKMLDTLQDLGIAGVVGCRRGGQEPFFQHHPRHPATRCGNKHTSAPGCHDC